MIITVVNSSKTTEYKEGQIAELEPSGYLSAESDSKHAYYLWCDQDDDVLFDQKETPSKFTPKKSGTYHLYLKDDLSKCYTINVKLVETPITSPVDSQYNSDNDIHFESKLTETSVFDPIILKKKIMIDFSKTELKLNVDVYVDGKLVKGNKYLIKPSSSIKMIPKASGGNNFYIYNWFVNGEPVSELYSSLDGIIKTTVLSSSWVCYVNQGQDRQDRQDRQDGVDVKQEITFEVEVEATVTWQDRTLIPVSEEKNTYTFRQPRNARDYDFNIIASGGSGLYDYKWIVPNGFINPGSINTLSFSSDEKNHIGIYQVIVSDVLNPQNSTSCQITIIKPFDPLAVKLSAFYDNHVFDDISNGQIFTPPHKHKIKLQVDPIGEIGRHIVKWFNGDDELKTINDHTITLNELGDYKVVVSNEVDPSIIINFSIQDPNQSVNQISVTYKYVSKGKEYTSDEKKQLLIERSDLGKLEAVINGIKDKYQIFWINSVGQEMSDNKIPIFYEGAYKLEICKHRTKEILYRSYVIIRFIKQLSPIQLFIDEQLVNNNEIVHVASDRVNIVGLINVEGIGNSNLQYELLINGQTEKTDTFHTVNDKTRLFLGSYKLMCVSTVKPKKKSFFSFCCSAKPKLISNFFTSDIILMIRDMKNRLVESCKITVKYQEGLDGKPIRKKILNESTDTLYQISKEDLLELQKSKKGSATRQIKMKEIDSISRSIH
jgi:hypothetical protein